MEKRRSIGLFLVFALIPIGMSFIAPAIFYQWPLEIAIPGTGREILVTLPNQSTQMALILVGVWILVFVASAYFLAEWFRHAAKKVVDIETCIDRQGFSGLWMLFILISIVGTAIAAVHGLIIFPAAFEPAVHQLSFLPACAMGLGIYIASKYRKTLSLTKWIALAFLVIVALIGGTVLHMLAGRAAPMAYVMLVLIFLLCFFRIWTLVVPLLVVVAVATGFSMAMKTEIRELAYGGGSGFERVQVSALWREGRKALSQSVKAPPKQYDMPSRMKAFGESDPNYRSIRGMAPDRSDLAKYVVARVLHRVNHLGEFAYVVQETPGTIPYTGMATYAPIFYVAIPRAFFPNKPINNSGQYFGHRYGFIWPNDKLTSVNLSIVLEGYMSAGVWGVVASAAMFAIFVTAVWMFIVVKLGALGLIVVGIPFFLNIANSESGFAAVVGGGGHAILVYGLLFLIMRYFLKRSAVQPV